MTKAADPNLEPFIDNLWYFNSVVSSKSFKTPHLSNSKSKSKSTSSSTPLDQSSDLTNCSESQLPLSTGGESSPRAAYSGTSYAFDQGCDEGGLSSGSGGRCSASCKRVGSCRRRPSMCELVEKMEEGGGELWAKELSLWMQKLGLEYTEDGVMIRRRMMQDAEVGSQQKLDFSEFVCLNRFIEEERSRWCSYDDEQQHRCCSDAHMYEVFRLFDKGGDGLISPSDLRAALAELGLTNPL